MANGDSVDITVRGIGGHGAQPQTTKDPVVVAAQIVLALQTIVSRENSPLDPVVVTVGSIHGGTKRNIIPDEVKLLLTVRTYKPEVRQRVLASIERMAKGVAIAAGIPEDRAPIVTVLASESTPSTYNDPALTQRDGGRGRETDRREECRGDRPGHGERRLRALLARSTRSRRNAARDRRRRSGENRQRRGAAVVAFIAIRADAGGSRSASSDRDRWRWCWTG